ncbi:u3 snorna associated [Fusarium heterosporum]|uniref:U3 snorna associated n=1 Tax=Fusarium heterosporum TaxID=42747 RepID=A0A8H5TEJ8_FUSHE|nr:u3 snorna associated [Fusarium heterosporum]
MAPKTRSGKSAQNLSAKTTTSDEKRKLPVRAKDGDSDSVKPSSAEPQGTKVVFGDDDDETAAPIPARISKPAAPAQEEESDEDSDDEAPEAVSTSKVASDIKKSNLAAQKAAQEQAAAQKRKRQEKNDFFKQQAEERKKLAEQQKAEQEDSSEDEEPAESLIQRSRTERAPNLLPAEFLTDSSSEDEQGKDDDRMEERPRKRRVATVERSLARQDRGPRDERVGSTVYRVATKADERMTPKLKKHTKSSKDLLLKRNRGAAKQRSGFFVK